MNPAELFVKHLDSITGQSESVIRKIETTQPPLRNVFAFVYRNWPHAGCITGFTFGLSDATHPDWKFGRPELMISVESEDERWPFAIGVMAEHLRGKCPFCYGDTINFHAEVSEHSRLDAFLVFAPPFLKREQMSVNLGSYVCNIKGMFPMYSSEFPLYHEIGLEKFWHLPGWDPFDINRPPLDASARDDT
jgi:hypothetical protein